MAATSMGGSVLWRPALSVSAVVVAMAVPELAAARKLVGVGADVCVGAVCGMWRAGGAGMVSGVKSGGRCGAGINGLGLGTGGLAGGDESPSGGRWAVAGKMSWSGRHCAVAESYTRLPGASAEALVASDDEPARAGAAALETLRGFGLASSGR